jgi:hypothetical protein
MAEADTKVPTETPAASVPVISGAPVEDPGHAAKKVKKDEKLAENPVVFFDIQIGGQDVGRIKMELFADSCPKTAENFRCVTYDHIF